MRFLTVLIAGVLVAAMTSVAQASHVPDCFERHPTNSPTDGDDVINGTTGDDVLAGGPGDDVIIGDGGNDRLCGNEGNDRILGNSGDIDRIDGGPGDDDLAGGGEFVIRAGCVLSDGAGGERAPAANVVHGGPGDDLMSGSGGEDALDGGDGGDCLLGLEGKDFLTGGSGADFLDGGSDEDFAVGEDDYDVLFGAGGNDKLFAGSTDVTLPEFPDSCAESGEFAGGAGPIEVGDLMWEGFRPTSPAFPPRKKRNELHGDSGANVGNGYDRLVGANRNDGMYGDERGDDLYGLGGNDFLEGGRASDCLAGGPDRDTLDDSDPSNVQPDDIDTLWGGGSADSLNALDGDTLDALDGGSRIADKCVFDQPTFSRPRGDIAISC